MAFKMKGFSPFDKKDKKTSMYAKAPLKDYDIDKGSHEHPHKPLKKKEKTPMYQKEDEAKVQYAGGDVINTKEYKKALKDGVKSESEFAEYKQMGREAWMKKNKKKVIEKLKVKKK